MHETTLSGSRIRNIRVDKGVRQADLAKLCGISASYLNLIEHNRRRIGGGLLLKIAKALEVDSVTLSGVEDRTLITSLSTAADRHREANAEQTRVDEFVGRYPGWARLIAAQQLETARLSQVVEKLSDRLTFDPYLSASMHNVLSSVTAIRSASAILAKGDDLEPEWQARFHRNVFEDSQRLVDATEALVQYLDTENTPESNGATLPQEDLEAWLNTIGWRVDALENDPTANIEDIIAKAAEISTKASSDLARKFLTRYADDVKQISSDRIEAAVTNGAEPIEMARQFEVSLPTVFRRLVAMKDTFARDNVTFGLVACDGSGAMLFRKPIPDFDVPRYSAGCPLWPIFDTLQRPMIPLEHQVQMQGAETTAFHTISIAEISHPAGFGGPAVVEAWMLFHPDERGQSSFGRDIGSSCRVCPMHACVARREPSVFEAIGNGFDSG